MPTAQAACISVSNAFTVGIRIDGVLDVDVATPATRGFFGFDVRIDVDGKNYEEIYLRQHKSGLPDAMQYTPVLNTGRQLANL